MQNNWNGRTITREEITLHEWLTKWLTHPTQRDHIKRANSPTFKRKMKNRTPKHLEVDGVICGCDFIDEVTGKQYRKGDKIKTDGHGRGYYFDNLVKEEKKAKSLFVSHLIVNSYEELIEAYTWFDSATDVEKANDRVDGAVRSVLHPQGKYITDDRLRKVTPIEYAAAGCFPEEFKRGETSTHSTIVTQVKHLQDALVWLHDDVLPHIGKKIRYDATLSTTYIMSYQKWVLKDVGKLDLLKKLIIQVSKGAMNNVEMPMDCASMLVEKWTDEESVQRGRGVLNMKPQSKEMQGFLLLMVDKFLSGAKHEKVPQNWRDYYKTWQEEYAKLKNTKGAQLSLTKQLHHV